MSDALSEDGADYTETLAFFRTSEFWFIGEFATSAAVEIFPPAGAAFRPSGVATKSAAARMMPSVAGTFA